MNLVISEKSKLYGKENLILDLYFNQQKSFRELQKILDVDAKTIRSLFKKNGIAARDTIQSQIHKNVRGNERDIKDMYYDEYSSYDIAEKYNVDVGTILNCLKRIGVTIRDASSARTTAKVLIGDENRRIKFTELQVLDIVDLYNDGFGASEIADKYDCDFAVIKKVLLDNGINFRSFNKMFTDKTKNKMKNTILLKHGSWENRNRLLNKKFQEKYGDGLTGAMQVKEFFLKNQESGNKFKKAIVEGVEIMYQGYELKGIYRLLSEGYKIEDIKIGRDCVPTFRYFYDGKRRVYYPDIYIPKDNRIVEVKSKWTYERFLSKNLAKKESVLEAGYLFDFYIMEK